MARQRRREMPAGRALQRPACSESSSSDDEFEKFLFRMKTPKSASCCTPRMRNSLNDSKENIFRDLTSKYGSGRKGKRPLRVQKVTSGTSGKAAAPSVPCLSPLVLSDPDSEAGDDSVFVKCTPRNVRGQTWSGRAGLPASSQKEPAASRGSPGSSLSEGEWYGPKEQPQCLRPRPSSVLGSGSSEEEIDCLAVRMKQRLGVSAAKGATGEMRTAEERSVQPSQKSTRRAVKSESVLAQPPKSPALGPAHPVSAQVLKSKKVLGDVSRMPERSSCQVQGCFLQELSDAESQQAKHFKSKKEELAQSLYAFYNHSVFEQKLPERMEIVWNKKMRKTAGCCVTGQLKDPEGQRYARIMLSEKVCDSADRLRDTLIHELCHAAVWLLHGVREGHGRFWSLYAKKSALIHPELPVVSRCHNYEIKYKFSYECSRCKNVCRGGRAHPATEGCSCPGAVFACQERRLRLCSPSPMNASGVVELSKEELRQGAEDAKQKYQAFPKGTGKH
ncbi:germ cell nuclear acidic protein-like isoform X3 [Hemicordylus capensis]|uniref:germ cell nuclear acidic protein-like isoform X3 n=1 Tax=Hemicordylus capensis TaxID=884348 RepID=UPI0023038695|nr:germ cell nuclear acidic protein-like isoform X3 [Hemicordylus capensis]